MRKHTSWLPGPNSLRMHDSPVSTLRVVGQNVALAQGKAAGLLF